MRTSGGDLPFASRFSASARVSRVSDAKRDRHRAHVTRDLEPVERMLQDFGAIVELADSATLGLLHISEIAHSRTANVTDEPAMGQELEVRPCQPRRGGGHKGGTPHLARVVGGEAAHRAPRQAKSETPGDLFWDAEGVIRPCTDPLEIE